MSFGVKSGGGDGVPVVMPPRVAVEEDGGGFAIANLLNFQGPGVAVSDGTQSGTKNILITGGRRAAWDQPTWWIDPINGNDTNDGLTASTPLKTAAQQHYRTGPVHEYDRNIDMTIAGDLPATDVLNLSGLRYAAPQIGSGPANIYFHVIGVPTLLASRTATIRPHSGNVPWGLTAGSLGSFVAPGVLLRKTSGSDANLTEFWLLKDEDGTIARFSGPAVRRVSGNMLGMTPGTIATNDTFDVLQLPKVQSVIFPRGMPLITGGLLTSLIDFTGFPTATGSLFHSACSFAAYESQDGEQNVTNCRTAAAVVTMRGGTALFNFGAIIGATFFRQGRIGLESGVVLQGCTMSNGAHASSESGGATLISINGGFGVFDSPVSGLVVSAGELLDIHEGPIYGSGNASHPLEVQRGGRVILRDDSARTGLILTGVGSDISLGGATSGPAIDPATYLPTAARAYSFANFLADVSAGGFGQNMYDPLMPCTCILRGD